MDHDIVDTNLLYTIQMFGLDEKGDTYSIKVHGFNPRFYCKVPDYWRKKDCTSI